MRPSKAGAKVIAPSITALAAACLLAAAPLGADLVLHGTRTARNLSADGSQAGAPRSIEIETWVGSNRCRLDEAEAASLIYRGDLGKVFLVDHGDQTFSELAVPVRIEDYLNARQIALLAETAALTDPAVEVTSAPTTEKRDGWTVRRSDVTVEVPGAGYRIEVTTWNTIGLAVDPGACRALVASYRELDIGRRRWAARLTDLPGYPVVERETLVFPDRRVETTNELRSVEEIDPGSAVYEVPAGYRRVAVDFPAQQLRVD